MPYVLFRLVFFVITTEKKHSGRQSGTKHTGVPSRAGANLRTRSAPLGQILRTTMYMHA